MNERAVKQGHFRDLVCFGKKSHWRFGVNRKEIFLLYFLLDLIDKTR